MTGRRKRCSSLQAGRSAPAHLDLADHLGIDANMAGTYLRRLHESGRIDKRTRGIYTPLFEVCEPFESDAEYNTSNASNTDYEEQHNDPR